MSTTEREESSNSESVVSNQKPEMPSGETHSENCVKEEERTLTDHLNKKLLQSFLARVDSGAQVIPHSALPQEREIQEEEEQNFTD